MIMGHKLELPKIALGATGLTVSRFGLGGFHQVEISSEIVNRVVDAFLEVVRTDAPWVLR